MKKSLGYFVCIFFFALFTFGKSFAKENIDGFLKEVDTKTNIDVVQPPKEQQSVSVQQEPAKEGNVQMNNDTKSKPKVVFAKYELSNAINRGDVEYAKKLIKQGYPVNEKDQLGITPLMQASSRGYSEIVTLLLSKKASINAKDIGGATALHIATRQGNIEVVRTLVEKGAHVNIKDNEGWTPLMRAASFDRKEIADILLANQNIQLDSKNKNGEKAIDIAVSNSKYNVTELLLNKYKQTNVANDDMDRLLSIASAKKDKKMVTLLDNHINYASNNLDTPKNVTTKNSDANKNNQVDNNLAKNLASKNSEPKDSKPNSVVIADVKTNSNQKSSKSEYINEMPWLVASNVDNSKAISNNNQSQEKPVNNNNAPKVEVKDNLKNREIQSNSSSMTYIDDLPWLSN